jgi:putative ABC transport system substrate-binding protein
MRWADNVLPLQRRQGTKRRQFMSLMGGAAAWPLAAKAQQRQQTRRVGVLVGLAQSEDAPIAQAFIKPFRESMRSAGWIEGGNIQINYRFGGPLADLSKTKASAAELIALKPDVILRACPQRLPFVN